MLVAPVHIKNDAFGGSPRCGKLLRPDGAAIGAKDVADVDGLCSTNHRVQESGYKKQILSHAIHNIMAKIIIFLLRFPIAPIFEEISVLLQAYFLWDKIVKK